MAQPDLIRHFIREAHEAFRLGLSKPAIVSSIKEFQKLSRAEQLVSFVPDAIVATLSHTESKDPLIDLQSFLQEHNSVIYLKFMSTQFGSVGDSMKIRTQAAEKLLEAEQNIQILLGENYSLCVTDAFRPLSLQRKYFDDIKLQIYEREGLTGKELYDRAHILVADPDLFPPHATGGAVDLTIMNISNKEEVDMGTKIDELENEYIFPFHAGLHSDQRNNRCILYGAMAAAGFVGYPAEWWHFSFGDKEWTLRSNQPEAIFTPIEE